MRKRSPGLAHDIVAELTQRILLGQLAPGEKLPSESAIVREHGVSRTVVREAISKLQAAGLVETRHGIGTFVLERDQRQGIHLSRDTAASVRGIIELRMGLETQAAALAARRRTEEQLLQMRQALDDHQDSLANNDSSVEPDLRFHQLIAQATGNSCFTDIIAQLGRSAIRVRGSTVRSAVMPTSSSWVKWPCSNTKRFCAPSAARTPTPPAPPCCCI